MAYDMGTALDIVAGVRLGPGKISVHPEQARPGGTRLRRVRGGTDRSRARARRARFVPKTVAALFPTVTTPAAEEAATTLKIPGWC